MNILVVEDERNLADAVCHILRQDGYHADAAYDGPDGLRFAASGLYDAMILDVMLPGMDGFEVARQLRHEGNPVPILMLTARSTTADKVDGLDSGADDYMTKPFETAELLARVRALTRRQGGVILDEVTFGDLTLDLNTHDLSCGTSTVFLPQKEFEVLRMLMSAAPGRVISKQDLLNSVWGAEANENSVEAYVSFLRKKLDKLQSKVSITTLRLLGYRLEELSFE